MEVEGQGEVWVEAREGGRARDEGSLGAVVIVEEAPAVLVGVEAVHLPLVLMEVQEVPPLEVMEPRLVSRGGEGSLGMRRGQRGEG